MMFIRRFGPILIGTLLFGVTILGMKPLIEYASNQLWLNQPGMIEAVGRKDHTEVLLGNLLQAKALATPDVLPFYGSSELGTGFEFNPSRVFNQREEGFRPFIIGRGSVQSLVNILNLAGQDHLQGRKLVFTFSPDWFSLRQGLENERFAMNSSPLHIYQTMLDSSLSLELKREIAQRILELPEVLKDDSLLENYLQAYINTDQWSQVKRIAYWPQAKIECAALEVQDVLHTRDLIYEVRHQPAERHSQTQADASWNTLIKQSEVRGKSLISNKLNILDTLYGKNTQPGSWSKLKVYPSKEYDDFDLMLRILEQKGAKPLFVLIPFNGLWADYAGFPSQERQDYYQRVRTMIQARGFEVADFSSKEYEPYFMQDIWHIGLKGWAEVDQVIDEYVHE